MNKKIKVLLVDDHGIVRNGLKMLLELDEHIEVCGEAGTINETMEILHEKCIPDIILLDFKLPDGDGIIGCRKIKNHYPDIKIIILTAYTEQYMVMETIKAGASGYLLKNIESEELIETVVDVYKGHTVLGSFATEKVFKTIKEGKTQDMMEKLSPKEVRILEMLSQGKTNKEIAEDLEITEKTTRNYVSSVLKKLNVDNRTEAAAYFLRKVY